MVGCVSAHIQRNVILNFELRCSYIALQSKLVLPSACTINNICRREYTVTVHSIKKQLPWRNEVTLALDEWTSMNKLAISSIISNYMYQNWALREAQLAFDEVDSPFYSYSESSLRITGQGSTYWSTPSQTFEGSSWSFQADSRRFTWNYNP